MTLTIYFYFLFLVTLATYTFMPWKGIDKGSLVKVASQWFMWFAIFAMIILIFNFFVEFWIIIFFNKQEF